MTRNIFEGLDIFVESMTLVKAKKELKNWQVWIALVKGKFATDMAGVKNKVVLKEMQKQRDRLVKWAENEVQEYKKYLKK